MFSRTRFFSLGLALVLLGVIGATGLAQQTQNPGANQTPGMNGQRPGRGRGLRQKPGRAGHFGPRVLSQLNLTDDQRKSLRAITEQTFQSRKGEREEMRQLRQKRLQGTLTVEEQARAKVLHQQMKAARLETKTQIAGLLTAEQKAKAEELIKERKANGERFRGRFGRKPGDPVLADPKKP